MAHLLRIDDDLALILGKVRQAFPAPAHTVAAASTGAAGLEDVRARLPDVILLDLRLPDQSGLDVYRQIRVIDARIPVIFVTMAKTADAAIEAMQQGAYDYLFKPLDPHRLRRVVGEALEVGRRMRQPAVVTESAPDPDVDGAIVGSCPAMGEVYKAIGRVGARHRSSPSTAPRFRRTCSNPSCSGTKRAPSPGPTAAASASSSSATAVRCSSMRSATCRRLCKPRSCGCCKSRPSSGSAATRQSGPTCG